MRKKQPCASKSYRGARKKKKNNSPLRKASPIDGFDRYPHFPSLRGRPINPKRSKPSSLIIPTAIGELEIIALVCSAKRRTKLRNRKVLEEGSSVGLRGNSPVLWGGARQLSRGAVCVCARLASFSEDGRKRGKQLSRRGPGSFFGGKLTCFRAFIPKSPSCL